MQQHAKKDQSTRIVCSDLDPDSLSCTGATAYLVHNEELRLQGNGAACRVILDGLQQVVSVPPESLHACGPGIRATLVVACAEAEHAPGDHAGGPGDGGGDLD